MYEKEWSDFHLYLVNKGTTARRIQKMHYVFHLVFEYINKPIAKIDKEDIQSFVSDLHADKFTKNDGSPYSGSYKADLKKFLKYYFKFFSGDDEHYPKLVSWIKTNIAKDEKPKDKPTLSLQEVQELAKQFTSPIKKIALLLFFDSGFRMDELESVTKEKLTYEPFDDDESCFWIECTRSKTAIRKIPVNLFTEDLQLYYNSIDYQSLKPGDKLFKISFPRFRYDIKRLAKKSIFKNRPEDADRLCFHALRHSSATYYANKVGLTEFQMCLRYGWTIGSQEARTYVRRGTSYQKNSAKQVFRGELDRIRKDLDEERKRRAELEKKIIFIEEAIKKGAL